MSKQMIDELVADPTQLNKMSGEELFDIDWQDVQEIQFRVMRKRFGEQRSKIRVLDRLAEDLGINDFANAEDATPLFFPHTMYKSYSLPHIEKGRYDKLTQWLASVTSEDLSKVDVSKCDSLESWLDAVEAASDLRPQCSSGTSGKISFFPRGEAEAMYRLNNFLVAHGKYRDEPDSGLASGEVDYYCPWPVATGRHNMPNMFEMLKKHVYGGEAGHVHTLGHGHWDVDLLWLSGRLRAAEAKGELSSLKLTPAMERLREKLVSTQQAEQSSIDQFLRELMVESDGKRVFLFAPFTQMIPLAQECKKRGLVGKFSPDSYVLAGGRSGSKGVEFPDGWLDLCEEVFPFPYQQVYGMTESTGVSRLCPAGHHHMPPWISLFLLDPDTSVPYERKGVQTGRLALFDILATSYWGGLITGDRITIDWEGGCTCGRKGPYIHNDIVRYSNLRDDDKVTCSKSPDAYEKAVELTLGATFE